MKKIISYLLAAVMLCGIIAVFPDDIGISVSAAVSEPPAAPKSQFESGSWTFSTGFYTEISCETKGADIYYSINGDKYKKYTGKIYIGQNVTLKTYSSLNGRKSSVNTYTYELKPKFEVTYSASNNKKTVKIKTDCKNVTFYYSTNGKNPTTKSKKYNDKSIDVTNVQKLRIIAVKDGWSNSAYAQAFTLTSDGKSKLDGYKNKFYYNSLSANEKKAYESIYKALESGKETADMKGFNIYHDEVITLYRYVFMENPQFLQAGWNVADWQLKNVDKDKWLVESITFECNRTNKNIAKIKDSFDKKTSEIIAEAKKKDTDYERLKYIYDAIQSNTTYESNAAHSKNCNIELYSHAKADSGLVHKKANCTGYSMTFCYLAQSLGYDCICVNGKSPNDHMWNAIKLDGKWYMLDLTWDDFYGDQKGKLQYDYFLLSEKNMNKDHSFYDKYNLPEFSKTDYAA